MRVQEHAGADTAAGATAAASRRKWAVVNMDSPYRQTLLVTRWRWYAGWWAASLRIFNGDDMRIFRASQVP